MLKDNSSNPFNIVVIVAALGYFILPTDLLADIIPVLGFTDDIAFLSFAVSTVSSFLTPEIKKKAMQKLSRTQLKELTE